MTITIPRRPWTLNVERQGKTNRWKLGDMVRDWRAEAKVLAHGQPSLAPPVAVTVTPTLRHRGSMPDTGACIGAVKAMIDGIVDAGKLPGDGPGVVVELLFLAPVVNGEPDALTVVVESVA